jgi:acyl carrier protein
MMTDNAAIDIDELRDTAAQVFEVDPAEMTYDAHFVLDLGADSLLLLELQLVLEQQYGIKVSEDEIKESISLRLTFELLSSKLATQ